MLWDGLTQFDKAAVYKATAVNIFYRDKTLELQNGTDLTWKSVTTASIIRTFAPLAGRDNPYYVRMTIEGGTQAWTNPNYVIRSIGN